MREEARERGITLEIHVENRRNKIGNKWYVWRSDKWMEKERYKSKSRRRKWKERKRERCRDTKREERRDH